MASAWDLLNLEGSLEEASTRIHKEFERHKLAQALREARGNRELTAARLKISHRDLLTKLDLHKLD
jgi:DNA-binding NtrC family response regulator